MAEPSALDFLLPLNPPPGLLQRLAAGQMDGYEPMTGRVGIEIAYLVRDCDMEHTMPTEIIDALRGIAYETDPAPELIHPHVHADGYVDGMMVVRVWQEGRE